LAARAAYFPALHGKQLDHDQIIDFRRFTQKNELFMIQMGLMPNPGCLSHLFSTRAARKARGTGFKELRRASRGATP
jgi:hypothetical protein